MRTNQVELLCSQSHSRIRAAVRTDGATLAYGGCMAYAETVDRVRTDFNDAPSMELTLGQAARLWHMGPDDCRFVLDSLVDAGFLHWTPRRTIARRTGTRVSTDRSQTTFS